VSFSEGEQLRERCEATLPTAAFLGLLVRLACRWIQDGELVNLTRQLFGLGFRAMLPVELEAPKHYGSGHGQCHQPGANHQLIGGYRWAIDPVEKRRQSDCRPTRKLRPVQDFLRGDFFFSFLLRRFVLCHVRRLSMQICHTV